MDASRAIIEDGSPISSAVASLSRQFRLAWTGMTVHAMGIAIFGVNYAPESSGIAPYTTGLARGLTERGHDVRVLTGYPHYPQWKRAVGTAGFRSEETTDGVRIRRFAHFVPQNVSMLGRATMELTFGLQLLTARWNRPSVVVCVSPPLVAAALVGMRARITPDRPAFGVLVHDVYSRAAVEAWGVRSSTARPIRALESAVLNLADGVVVIHDGFVRGLVDDLRVDPRRIRSIRNWNHVAAPDPAASREFRARHGWTPDDVVVLHAGNMGAKQGLENVIAAAELASRSGSRARFVLLGDGNQRRRLQESGADVSTLEFLPPLAENEFPAALGAADVLLVNERPGVAQMAVPSKLTTYFRSGKPIIAATDSGGFTAMEISASGAGICIPAGRPDLLLREAVRIGSDPDLALALGAAGRNYCAETLSATAALDRYEQWIRDLADARHPSPRGGSGRDEHDG